MNAPSTSATAAGGNPLRILIVEDEALVSEDIARTIEELGGVVAGQAAGFAEAEAIATATAADGAFVDLNLCDGPSGCDLARLLSERFGLPVVFLTGDPERVPNGFPHALAVIEKPVSPGRIKVAMTLLGRTRAVGLDAA